MTAEIKIDMSKDSHGDLFNAVGRVLRELSGSGRRPGFSDRLAATECTLEALNDWLEQWKHGETLKYQERVEKEGHDGNR